MRIMLFLATNAAILVLISLVFQIFGLEGILQENGVDLNFQALLIMSASNTQPSGAQRWTSRNI